MSARHHSDVILCRRLPGTTRGRLCTTCEGRCVICDSYIRPSAPVRLCDMCNYGSSAGRCVICDAPNAPFLAWYCRECTVMEKDRDGCPKATNVASAKLDLWYERKKKREPPKLLVEHEREIKRDIHEKG